MYEHFHHAFAQTRELEHIAVLVKFYNQQLIATKDSPNIRDIPLSFADRYRLDGKLPLPIDTIEDIKGLGTVELKMFEAGGFRAHGKLVGWVPVWHTFHGGLLELEIIKLGKSLCGL